MILAKKIHPAIEDSEENAMLWSSFLIEYPDEIGLAALHQHLKTSSFSPKPADISRIAETMRTDKPPLAEDAWREVSKNLNQYKKPEWSHELIAKTVKSIGYLVLCMSENPEFSRNQFIKTYEKYCNRQQQDERNAISLGNSKLLESAVLQLGEKMGV